MTSRAQPSNLKTTTSAKSLATLVEAGLDVSETKGYSFENIHADLPFCPPKKQFGDQLLGMFCIKWLKMSKGGSQVDSKTAAWPSPWILPAHVVSNRQDKDRRPITKIAKCTIDTGNMQGNIVSRDFVESVLDFPSASFEKLTSEEQMGGIGITGDLHTPLGAIHLTWYHSSSTRVFRNMRFLISPAPYCDMIIGAQSIQKEKILSVPCLVDRNIAAIHESLEKVLGQLKLIKGLVDEQLANKFRDGIAKDDLPDVVERLENELEVVKWIMKLHSIAHRKSGVSPTAEDGLWDKIIEHYPEISDGLNEQLKHMQVLVNLRILLGHKDSQNPWKKPTVQWWDGANFETVNAHQ